MSDLPTQGLLQQMHAKPRSGEDLEVFGKKAAARWSSGEYPTLTAAVTETVKQAQLAPEQVRRVVEFANTAAYLVEFKKEGSTHRVIDFQGGPADASEILKDLNDGGGGSTYDRGTLDYASPPTETKTASAEGDEALAELFGVREAAAPLPYANPHEEVISLKDKLAGAAAHLQSQISGLEVMYAETGDRVYGEVKQASLSDVTLGQIMKAWECVAPSDEYVKIAFQLITPRLLREGVFHRIEDMTASIDKTASPGLLNVNHPLVTEFTDFCLVLQKLAETRAARTELREHHQHLQNYVKTAASTVGKIWSGAKSVAGGAAEKATPFLREHLGDTAAGVIGTGMKYAPHAALGVGALEANRRINNSPSAPARAARATKNVVLRNIPGTQENLMEQYRIQSGQ